MTIQIPIGFRFVPTEEELVVDYLRPKILNCTLPCDIIPVKNIYKLNPEQLSDLEIGEYFFTLREKKHPNGSYSNRVVADGYWSSRRVGNYIYNDKGRVGKKNLLKYIKGKNQTHWWMDEYELIDKKEEWQLEDWVICKIRKSKSKSKKHTPSINEEIPVIEASLPVDEGLSSSGNIVQGPPLSLPQFNSQDFNYVLPVDEGLGSSGNVVHRGPRISPSMYNSQEFDNVLSKYDSKFPENISHKPPVELQGMCVDEGPSNSRNVIWDPPLCNSQEFKGMCVDEGPGSSRNVVFPVDEGPGSPGNVVQGPPIFPPLNNSQEFNNVLPKNISDNPPSVDVQGMGMWIDEGPGSFGNAIFSPLYNSQDFNYVLPENISYNHLLADGQAALVDEGLGSCGNVVHPGPPMSPRSPLSISFFFLLFF